MSDPEINYNPKRHHNVNESIKKNEERKRELLRLVGRVRVYFFRIYFLSLIIVSIFLLVYYWPHQTFEDRITSINSTLSIDAEKLQSIESSLNSTSFANQTNSNQEELLYEKKNLLDEIHYYQFQKAEYQMKLLGKISPFSSDWFYVSVVKNFIIVILAGTLGGSVAAYRSFNSFLGRRKLIMSWDSFYLFRPIQGSIMGLISYVLIRSGIYAGVPGASIDDANLFVVAAGALVAGLYSDELYSKFHEVFDLLFKVKDQKGDTIEAVQKYPAIVQKIIDDSLLPENEIMVVLTKDGSTLIDDKHLHVLDSSKSYWIIKFLVGKEEIHVISDESKLIVCKYNAKE